jgi:hypothetical protein
MLKYFQSLLPQGEYVNVISSCYYKYIDEDEGEDEDEDAGDIRHSIICYEFYPHKGNVYEWPIGIDLSPTDNSKDFFISPEGQKTTGLPVDE